MDPQHMLLRWGNYNNTQKIVDFCRARRLPYLIVPAPFVTNILRKRNSGYYPGTLANILDIESLRYLYPIEDFADAQLKLVNKARQEGRALRTCPLFNTATSDNHFSAAGSEVWAESVGRRLILLLGESPRAEILRRKHLRTMRASWDRRTEPAPTKPRAYAPRRCRRGLCPPISLLE